MANVFLAVGCDQRKVGQYWSGLSMPVTLTFLMPSSGHICSPVQMPLMAAADQRKCSSHSGFQDLPDLA